MSNNLLGAKLHFKKLYEKDNGFIERFGTTEQKEAWVKGGNNMISCQTENELKSITQQLGKIRDEIHTSNEHDTNYRLYYLQKGSESIEEIRRVLGAEIAEAVSKLRNLPNA